MALLPWDIVFALLLLLLSLCVLTIIIGLPSMIGHVFYNRDFPVNMAIVLIASFFPVIVGYKSVGLEGLRAPLLNDISTDMVNPPVFEYAYMLRSSDDNSLDYRYDYNSPLQTAAYPDITGLEVKLSVREAKHFARRVMIYEGWKITKDNMSSNTIEAITETLIMGFKDDIAVRFTPLGIDGCMVDIRSASRVGLGDLGTNTRRIRRFLKRFQSQIAKHQAGKKLNSVTLDTVPAAT